MVESTGFFTDREGAQKHLDAGAKKVVISAPATDPDLTVVLGVNDDAYDPESHHIVSNASCTTNCVAPLAKVLHELGEIQSGLHDDDPRVHERPGDPRLPAQGPAPGACGRDQPHPDLDRRGEGDRARPPRAPGEGGRHLRACARRHGLAHGPRGHAGPRDERRRGQRRLPRRRGQRPARGLLHYTEDPIVSTDINGNAYSCIFDSQLTMVQGSTVKVFGWYDNEWGYSCRLVDLIGKLLP